MIRDSYYSKMFTCRSDLLSVLADLNDDECIHLCSNLKVMLTEFELSKFSKEV